MGTGKEFQHGVGIQPGGGMLTNAVMATVGAVGVGFYLRFLVALSRESKRSLVGHWLRLRTRAHEPTVTELHSEEEPVTRAAA